MGWPQLKLELDVSVGGALGDMSAYVTEVGGWTKEALVEELTAAGDVTDRWAAVGFTMKAPITWQGPYDNTASKFVAVCLANLGGQLTMQQTFDLGVATDVETCEVIVQKIERVPKRKGLIDVKVTFQPTGAVT